MIHFTLWVFDCEFQDALLIHVPFNKHEASFIFEIL